jgi:hypothetical protein
LEAGSDELPHAATTRRIVATTAIRLPLRPRARKKRSEPEHRGASETGLHPPE